VVRRRVRRAARRGAARRGAARRGAVGRCGERAPLRLGDVGDAARDDERHACFVNEHAVALVHHAEVELARNHLAAEAGAELGGGGWAWGRGLGLGGGG
jgi:hypothetical protein